MRIRCKFRQFLAGKGGGSGGMDAGGAEVGQQNGQHDAKGAGSSQEPQLMSELVGVVG